MRCCAATLALLWTFSAVTLLADEPQQAASGETAERKLLFEHFEKTLSGVKLVGRFTVIGKEDGELPKEEYTIEKVEKLPDGDLWLFKARIKYGQNDRPASLPLEVKWAGTTPIITLTDFTIPGMGTFSSRIVIYRGRYAGTWTHGNVGGHMFGVIEKLPADGDAADSE